MEWYWIVLLTQMVLSAIIGLFYIVCLCDESVRFPITPWGIWEELYNKINWFGLVLISLIEIIFIPFFYIPIVLISVLIKLATLKKNKKIGGLNV